MTTVHRPMSPQLEKWGCLRNKVVKNPICFKFTRWSDDRARPAPRKRRSAASLAGCATRPCVWSAWMSCQSAAEDSLCLRQPFKKLPAASSSLICTTRQRIKHLWPPREKSRAWRGDERRKNTGRGGREGWRLLWPVCGCSQKHQVY